MLKNKKKIRVRIRFAAADKVFECGLVPDLTLRDNLEMIYQMIAEDLSETYLVSGEERVYDAQSLHEYDCNVSLASNGISDASVLIVY